MKTFTQRVKRFFTSEDGPTAVEYAVMLALILLFCLIAIRAVGFNMARNFDGASEALLSGPGATGNP